MNAGRIGIIILLCMLISSTCTAEYQWSVPADEKGRMAYLWIPPSCQQVRGVIWGDQNTLEEPALRDPIIREAAAKAGLAIVYTASKSFPFFKYKEGAGERLEAVLRNFAKESGYSEIEFAPIITIGHSASSPFAWYVGAWKPERTLAIISLKGAIFPHPDFDANASIEDVPSLAITGEYYEYPSVEKSRFEKWKAFNAIFLSMRKASDRNLSSLFIDVSGGHMNWTDELAKVIAMYITKAVQYRLPIDAPLDGPVKLKIIDPKSGWLMEPNAFKVKEPVMAAYAKYPGKPSEAAWYFDKEMAEAVANYGRDQKDKLYQMVGFVQDGNVLPVAVKGWTEIRYEPVPDDDMTFKLMGTYLQETPPELINQGKLNGHSGVPVRVSKLSGPAVQTGVDTFRVEYNIPYSTFPTLIHMTAHSPGDEKYRYAYQHGSIWIYPNKEGRKQTIDFPHIPDQIVGAKAVELKATTDCNLAVQYYVKYGPAEMQGDRVVFTKLPPRSKFPVKVCVVANQWGRMREPKVQTAKPVEQTFVINNNDIK